MRKYILLICSGFLSLASLLYFYKQSEGQLLRKHEDTLKLLAQARNAESSLEKGLLKSRGFLIYNYDTIVSSEAELSKACTELLNSSSLLDAPESSFDATVADYCSNIKNKLDDIEHFKSYNAIYKNSIHVLHKTVMDRVSLEKNFQGNGNILRNNLVKATLAYALLATEENKSLLNEILQQTKMYIEHNPSRTELANIFSHANKIYEIKETLNNLTKNVVDSRSNNQLDQIKEAYLQNYMQSEHKATQYRKISFSICVIFLFLIIFGVFRLWKTASMLAAANANLENRVLERTKALKESQDILTKQQQLLASTSKMSALGEMAGGMAHEINTPLATIKIISEQIQDILNDETVDRAFIKDATNDLIKTSDRIAKIVSSLRAFARIGSNDAIQNVSVKSVVEGTVILCRQRFMAHGVDLFLDDISEDLRIEVRKSEISQVLLNLLNNAYDAALKQEQKWIRLTALEKQDSIEIEITDSGKGIEEPVIGKLFQPFFTTKEIGSGTGLSLSVSLGIMKSHNGNLVLDANGPNTKFIMILPKYSKGVKNNAA